MRHYHKSREQLVAGHNTGTDLSYFELLSWPGRRFQALDIDYFKKFVKLSMVEHTKKPVLGYWKIRGLAAPIRYIFEYLKVPFEDKFYEQGDAPDFDVSCWTSEKYALGLDFPNLPYLIDGDLKITESQAILRYVVNKYGPHLNGKNVEDQARVDMVYSVLTDIK